MKTIIITGGTSGIGLDIANFFYKVFWYRGSWNSFQHFYAIEISFDMDCSSKNASNALVKFHEENTFRYLISPNYYCS